jgi:tRNA-specific 2-thiouridylase
MSGGVDSSVAAALLVEDGYDVVGVTLRVSPWHEASDPAGRFGSCCGSEAAGDAGRVARALGVPHYVLNSEGEFDHAVIQPFVDAYRAGRTPVPCLACNSDLKFGSLLARARAWDAAFVATGHYARVTTDAATGRHLLWRAHDRRKDQTDFLWTLTQAQLGSVLFPVGGLTKAEVRAIARRHGLPTAEKPESQEVCFIPDGNYRNFLRTRDPASFSPGPILSLDGEVLGRHAGVANFTIGQRRGLGLAGGGRAQYVVDLDASRGAVTVGDAGDLVTRRLVARRANFISADPPSEALRIEARIRHNHDPAPAALSATGEGEVELLFDEPQRAVTPGQSVVFYQGDLVVGGAVIDRR